jgi:hypothetical protein
MQCSSSDTWVFNMTEPSSNLDANVLAEFEPAAAVIVKHGQRLKAILGEKKLKVGLIEGSAFCAAATLSGGKRTEKALLSPEEMTAHMATMLLAEG